MIDFGRGVTLHRIEPEDIEVLRSWRNDPSIWAWCRQNDLIHFEGQQDWYERQAKDPSISMYKIENTRNAVGVCGLTSIDHLNQRAEFSLYVAPDEQGKGYARKALETLFSHGFKNLNLNMIWGETFAGNPAARLFESLGMTKEGTRRAFYWKGGQFIDAHLYSILRSEWTL